MCVVHSCLHHPDGVGTDGVVKMFPFNLFFGVVLWKACAQERYVGPSVSEKKSSLTMKTKVGSTQLCGTLICT